MKLSISILLAGLALAGCDLRYALGLPEPKYAMAVSSAPIELAYREAKGGLVVLTALVNDKAHVDFILDTGAPVTVLLDGKRTAALGLDSSKARPLGDPDNPATPTGDIQGGFRVDFGGVALSELTAVVIPLHTMPCQERFEEIGFGGVIGADLFRRFVVEIDPAAKRVRLHDPKSWRAPLTAVALPIRFSNGHPFVDTRLALSDGRVVETSMNLDTGMNRALTLIAGAHPAITMPADGKLRKSCLVNGVREEREGDALTLHLGGVELPVAAPIYSDRPNVVDGSKAGTLGASLFASHRIFIDYPAKRLVIHHRG
jgi:hypothetical protein